MLNPQGYHRVLRHQFMKPGDKPIVDPEQIVFYGARPEGVNIDVYWWELVRTLEPEG